jgi:hypothetical protein
MSSQIVASVPLLDTVHQDFPGGSLRFKQNKRSNTYQIHFSLLISVIIWLQRHASTTLSTYKCPASPKSKPVVGERNDVRFRKEVGTLKVPIAVSPSLSSKFHLWSSRCYSGPQSRMENNLKHLLQSLFNIHLATSRYCSHIIDSDVTCHIGLCRSELWQRSQCHRQSCREVKV